MCLEPEEPLFPVVPAPPLGSRDTTAGEVGEELDPIRQRKALEHMDPNVWSKHNSLVSVLQGDFYQHCNNNSSLPEGLMGLVLLVLIDLGWRPALSPAQPRRAGSVLQP